MNYQNKTKDKLIEELQKLKKELASLKQSYSNDLAELRQAKNDLEFNNVLLRTQAEASIDGVLVVDRKGMILSFNHRFVDMWGIPPEVIKAKSDKIALLYVMDKLANPKEFDSKVKGIYKAHDKIFRDEVSLKDGRIFDRYSVPIKGTDGKYFGRVWYFSDITEQKQSHNKLRESEEKYRMLINNANESIVVLQNGLFKLVNPITIKLLEVRNERELLNKPFFEIIHADDRAMVADNYRRRMANEAIPDSYAFRISIRTGVVRWVEAHVTWIEWEGKPATMHFMKDVTERKLAEHDLQNMKESLENLTKHLDDIREDERTSISRKIHDEFSQSLTALKIDLKWLCGKIAKGSEEDIRLEKMIELVNYTSKAAQRISSELRSPIMDDLGLAATLEWYGEEFEKRTSLQVNMELDEVQSENTNKNLVIYRVFQESLTNIIRHANAKKVQIKLCKIKNDLVLTVQDNGIGIPPDKIKSPKSLGLIGMFERVRQSGGHIDITTPVSGGTKIIVYIPI